MATAQAYKTETKTGSSGKAGKRVSTRSAKNVTALKDDFKVELWPLHEVKPYDKNARKISPAAIEKVAKTLAEFGWRQPMVVDADGVLIVGHARRLGALHNGWAEGPVHVAKDLTPEQIKAYRLMDNRSHDEATWDLGLAGEELLDLQGMDFDLDLTGFDEDEIEKMLAGDPLAPSGDAPSENMQTAFGVVIDCTSEREQIKLLEEFTERGLDCRALM